MRRPRIPYHLARGTGISNPNWAKCIRLVRYGCTNRPFFHIVVMHNKEEQRKPPIEQLGSYDECVNEHNEKLVAFNFERIQYWIGQGADISKPVRELLGLAGFLPIHPTTYMQAWRTRRKNEAAAKEETQADASEKSS